MSRTQRESPIAQIKKDTFLNLKILSYARPMQPQLALLLFKDNSLDKPTQNLFNYLSHYLATIIDSQAASKLTFPLFDSKAERAFRNELNVFICSDKRLTPVMPSFFINPGCYKVTFLISQMSTLALKTVIKQVGNDSQKTILKDFDETILTGCDKDTLEKLVDKTQLIYQNKISNYHIKDQIVKNASSKLCNKIVENKKLFEEAMMYINRLVDNCSESELSDDTSKHNILSIKNVIEENQFFDVWLDYVDSQIVKMEEQFIKNTPFIDLCHQVFQTTKEVVMRFTDQKCRNECIMSYNHNTDKIVTQDLECQVNIEQAHILKNIVLDEKLNFPNLIKAYAIYIKHILKNKKFDDEIFTLNQNLEIDKLKYHKISHGLQISMEKIISTENKLQYTPPMVQYSNYGYGNIYPGSLSGPCLINLKSCSDKQASSKTFTPINISSKCKFNFKVTANNYKEPMLINLQPSIDDLMKSIISCNMYPNSNYDINSISNTSVQSNVKCKETKANCASGFTKQQIDRLFSRKKSSSKKLQYRTDRLANIKSRALNYDEVSKDISGLTQSCSPPNLYEHKKKISISTDQKLSIMKEDSIYQFAGTSGFCDNSNTCTPCFANAESTVKVVETDTSIDLNNCSKETTFSTSHIIQSTPEKKTHSIIKTSSIEKIIKRFKKVRASVIPPKQSCNELAERTLSRSIMPDLLSPSVSLRKNHHNSLDCDEPKLGDSFGAALGVDDTFLDQFDLIE